MEGLIEGEKREFMTHIIAFLLETFQGFICLAGIPLIIAIAVEFVRMGGLKGAEQRLKRRQHHSSQASSEEDIFQETDFERSVRPRSIKPHRNEWFSQAGRTVHGFEGIQKFKVDSFKRSIPPYLAVILFEYLLFLPFLGHLGCIASNWLQTHVGFGLPNIGDEYLTMHLSLATLYAAMELVLHTIGLVIRTKEQAVFSILCSMRDYLCGQLGKTRGDEAARFVALIMDVYMDSEDRRDFIRQAKRMQVADEDRGRVLLQYVLSFFDSMQASLHAVSMTQEGEALLKEIRVCV